MAVDPTQGHLDALEPGTQWRAWWLVWAVRTAGVPLIITSSTRSLAEQQRYVASGNSRTLRSKHLEGKAFDVDVLGIGRDEVPRWFWDTIGPWAEMNLGLRWGGRWKDPYDPGHFENPL